jgi:hypothetical protein
MRSLALALLVAACAHRPYPPPVEEAFMARCAHTLWPAYRPAATPAELTTYCRCVLREQERDWDLEEYNEEWTKVDAGYYATPREVLGVSRRGARTIRTS